MKIKEARKLIQTLFEKSGKLTVQEVCEQSKLPLVSVYSVLKYMKNMDVLDEIEGSGTNKLYQFNSESNNSIQKVHVDEGQVKPKEEVKKTSRDTSLFEFRGVNRNKGQTALEVLRVFVTEHDSKLKDIKKAFPDEIVSKWGVTQEFDQAINQKYQRYFIKENQVIKTMDGIKICVTNQWDVTRFNAFIEIASSHGYKIVRQ